MPSLLDARIDLLLAVAAVLAFVPVWVGARRLSPGPAVGLRLAAMLAAWVSVWTLLARALPVARASSTWFALWVGGFALGLLAVGVAYRAARSSHPQRQEILSSLVFGFSALYVCLGTVPSAFGLAAELAKLASVEAGDVAVTTAESLGATSGALARLSGATCRSDIAVAWEERQRNGVIRTTYWAVVDPGWTIDQPIGAWTRRCEATWDLVSVEGEVTGRLASDSAAWKRADRVVVVAPVTTGEIVAAVLTESRWFRSLLAASLVAGLAVGRLFHVRPGDAVSAAPSPSIVAQPTARPLGKKSSGPGWPGRRR